jgi:drug/metabolite transporter (DMT)-like permease
MSGLTYALFAVLSSALLRITLKHCALSSDRAWATLILYHLGAAAVLLPFMGIPTLSTLSPHQIVLLLASGALFAMAALLDIYAMKHIDASAGEVFHTLTFIVSVAAGLFMFHEECSGPKVIGALIIVAGILYEARRALLNTTHGFVYKLGSAALIAASMIITKYLTESTPSETIILSGFVIPGLAYVAVGRRDLVEIPATIRKSNGLILAVPVFGAMSYAFGIKALAVGEMSTTYMIFQTTISAVFLLEVLLHGWNREVYLHRAVSAGLCMCGALIALVSW